MNFVLIVMCTVAVLAAVLVLVRHAQQSATSLGSTCEAPHDIDGPCREFPRWVIGGKTLCSRHADELHG